MSARLHMIRADVNMREFQRWAGSHGMIRAGAFDEGYAMHCLLKGIYGERAPKPFRIIAPRDARKGVLYGYAEADADELRELADCFCDPLQASIIPAELRPEQGDARRVARGTASRIRDARPPRRPLAGNRRDDFGVGESPRGGGAASRIRARREDGRGGRISVRIRPSRQERDGAVARLRI